MKEIPAAPQRRIQLVDAIHNRWWFDATLRGEYPADLLESYGSLADAIQPGDMEVIAQPLDWMGINYYFDILVRGVDAGDATTRMLAYPTVTGVTEAAEHPVHTDWAKSPRGSHRAAHTARRLPNMPPIYITENGTRDDPVVDGRCADPRHIDYLDEHTR